MKKEEGKMKKHLATTAPTEVLYSSFFILSSK